MPSVTAVLCARTGSERFPGKVLEDIDGRCAIEWIIARLRLCRTVASIVVATTDGNDDDRIAAVAARLDVPCFRGSVNDVVERMDGAIRRYSERNAFVLRALADQPFVDWGAIDDAALLMEARGWDFLLPLSFDQDPVYGAGLSPWSPRTWSAIAGHSRPGEEREHPGTWLRRNLGRFDYALVDLPHWAYRGYRLELDTPQDLALIRAIHAAWAKPTIPPPLSWVVDYLDKHRALASMNSDVHEKTGTYTTHTRAEVEGWWRDYANRPVVFSDLPTMMAQTGEEGNRTHCRACGGIFLVHRIRAQSVTMRCSRCGNKRTFYARAQGNGE